MVILSNLWCRSVGRLVARLVLKGVDMQTVSHYSLDSHHRKAIDAIVRSLPTPLSVDDAANKTEFGASFIDHLVIDKALDYGIPYSFKYEQNGAIVQNIFPIPKLASEQISSSSTVELSLHTEVAFHCDRPDSLILFCVRADENAGTTYAELREILKIIPRWAIEQLKQPNFSFDIDLSFVMNGSPTEQTIQSIFNETLSEMTYDYQAVSALTNDAQLALHYLEQAIRICTKVVYLRSGDFLVLPNRQALHGRTKFSPRFDGTDRWLKRVIVRQNSRPIQSVDDVNILGAE